jgi:two-component system NtrC family sensor kinase
MTTILNEVLESQLAMLCEKNIKVERNYCAKKQILGIPAELKHLFMNLVDNAAHAMPGGGRLRVSFRESYEMKTSRHGIRVNVTDTGAADIPSERSKRLLEPFLTTKLSKGAGHGLWSSKGIVQKYGGTIDFRSLHVNGTNATCFSIFIPGLAASSSIRTELEPWAQPWKVQAASF